MKQVRNGTTLFFIVIMIFAFSTYQSQHFFQSIFLNSQSSLTVNKIPPLEKNNLSPIHTPRTGIIPPSNTPRSPRGSINEIIDPQDQYFPGSEIHIRNQFEIPQFPGYYIVEQVVFIFLFKNDTANSTMEAQGDINTSSVNYVHNATTNGTKVVGGASLSINDNHGWIDTTFMIPGLTSLNNMGIQADDSVTIFQYYPAQNISESKLGKDFNITRIDTFKLSSVATFTSDGFINVASGDEIFRHGENAMTVLRADSGGTPIDNVTVTISGLYNKSNDVEITNPTLLGITHQLLGTTTNATGELELIVSTTYSTPEWEYYFNVTADFTGTDFYTENYGKIASTTANFTVYNAPDIVAVSVTDVTDDPIEPPNVNNTIVTITVQASNAYGGSYNPQYVPVNATLDVAEPWVNISFEGSYLDNGTGWALTDSNGQVKFIISAGYPIPYELKTPIITVTADLHNTSAPGGNYPTGHPDGPHRFMENSTGFKTDTETRAISIDPDFWIGEVVRFSRTRSTIRPGESAILEFEVHSQDNNSEKFDNVPVKISLDESIPGVSLSFNTGRNQQYGTSGYYYTDSSGIIEVTVSSTYLLTPELVRNIAFNITADFENDSKIRWIGDTNAIDGGAANTLANFNKTWLSVIRTVDLAIDPAFNNCTISFFTTNESGDTTIRPGDDLIVTFVVRNAGGTRLSNVYTKISLGDSYPGVSLAIHPSSGSQDPSRSNYYYTNGSGYITVNITTTYGTTPKNLDIKLNAIADFENDTYDKWWVGSKGVRPDFRSNSSYSEGSRTITVAPQYFIGDIYIPTDNPPNATLVQHYETLKIEFRLQLREYLGGPWISPPIDGVNISILINGQTPDQFYMSVADSWNYSDDSSVIFYITMNISGLTPEATYTLEATADFGAAQALTYNFTHATVPSGHLSGIWVNGSTTDDSSKISYNFEVKNIDIIRVWIPSGGVTDPFHSDVGFNSTSGLFEVYRSTTNIQINGTYKDNTQQPVVGKQLEIRMNHSNAQRVLLASNVYSYSWGFSVVIQLPSNTPLEDNIVIYGEDPIPPTPPEGREGYSDIRVVTTIDLSDMTVTIANGSAVFVGESVSISGTLVDNLGLPIDSVPANSPFSATFAELTNNIRVVGWNGTHEIGIAQIASPNPDGTYGLSYQIPNNYALDTLTIRLNITNSGLIHYRVNSTEAQIDVYWDFQLTGLEIYFPYNLTSTGLTIGDTILVLGENNRDITIRGTLIDNSSRGLGGKWIKTTWNDIISPTTHAVNAAPAGYFTLDYSFTGLANGTWTWEFRHLLDNGTELSRFYTITLNWVVFDITAPLLTIITPNQTSPGVAFLLANDITTIIVNATDPSLDAVSDGLDNSSVVIQIDGVNHSMNQIAGQYRFSYDWATPKASLLDINYTIIIFASDMANNWNTSGITVIFDVVAPIGAITVQENENGYLEVDSDGLVIIAGTIEDTSSTSGLNFGIDETSASLFIRNSPTNSIEVGGGISITNNSYSYEWGIILNPDDLDLLYRNDSFIGFEDWTITVTFSDLAGNIGTVSRSVKLDKTDPKIEIVDDFPEKVDKELMLTVFYEDPGTGIYLESLVYEIRNSTDNVIFSVRYGDANIESVSDSQIILIIDTSELPKGEYTLKIKILDNTGNLGDVVSDSFTVSHPSPPNPFTNIIVLLVSPVLAFGGGVGLAAVYERFKGLRGG